MASDDPGAFNLFHFRKIKLDLGLSFREKIKMQELSRLRVFRPISQWQKKNFSSFTRICLYLILTCFTAHRSLIRTSSPKFKKRKEKEKKCFGSACGES